MKATGVVRRIDDLGRVVIPKEIRRTLRIREGDPIEIFTDRDGGVILKKYSPVGEITPLAAQYADSIAQVTKCTVCITDTQEIVVAAGTGKREFAGKKISEDFRRCLNERREKNTARGERGFVTLTEGQSQLFVQEVICPVFAEGDVVGAVVLLGKGEKGKLEKAEEKIALAASVFLGKQMEF